MTEHAQALTPEEFAEAVGANAESLDKLKIYAMLLETWNRRINLVSKNSLKDLWRRHFLDSAQLMAHLPPAPADRGREILDLGSGAGFPGLVLAILGAGRVHLVDSDQRKQVFLREVVRLTGAPAVLHPVRIEALEPFPLDLITARALAPLDQLLGYASRFRSPNLDRPPPCLFLKGARADQELTAVHKAWKMTVESFPSRSESTGTILSIGIDGREPTTY